MAYTRHAGARRCSLADAVVVSKHMCREERDPGFLVPDNNSIGSKLAAEVPDPFTWRAVHLENEAARRDRAAAWEFPH